MLIHLFRFGARAGEVCVRNFETEQQIYSLRGTHKKQIMRMQVYAQGQKFLAASIDDTISFYAITRLQQGTLRVELEKVLNNSQFGGIASCQLLVPNLLALGNQQGDLLLVDNKSHQILHRTKSNK